MATMGTLITGVQQDQIVNIPDKFQNFTNGI